MRHPSHIIAIGASAGGLEALKSFFGEKLQGTSFAFVIIQHISPNHKSLMPELLSKVTDIPVVTIEENREIEAGHIYLIPRGHNVKLDGWNFVTEPTDPLRRVLNLPINIFFQSVAETHSESVIGVILSGTGSDGALGLQRIHEMGGLTLVQSPESAQFDGMPRAALDAVRADFIIRPSEMIAEIKKYCENLKDQVPTTEDAPLPAEEEETLAQIFSILESRVGVNYSRYKTPTLVRRIEKRMRLRHISNLVEYADLLTLDNDECHDLAKDFLINVTQFFRDPEFFEALYRRAIIPMVRNAKPGESLRIWVPACATGEEAYTLSMLFLEAENELQTRVMFKIFATDLDQESIQIASRGVYPLSIVSVMPERFRNKYFKQRDSSFVVEPILRERVLFAPQDIISSPPFRKLNLISCRNALIYFKHDLQISLLKKFHYSLVPGGILFLGSSESVSDAKEDFEVIYSKGKIFRKTGTGSSPLLGWAHNIKPDSQLGLASTHASSQQLVRPHTAESKKAPPFMSALAESLLAPGVLIDTKLQILHFIGDASKYFAHPSGEATFEVLRLVKPQFKSVVRSAATKLLSESETQHIFYEVSDDAAGAAVIVHGQRFTTSGSIAASLEAQPASQLVLFLGFKTKNEFENKIRFVETSHATESIINDLEDELAATKERLQNSIEALEASNEELHSTNEELLSANEELQSTNEELQSVNEELHTVNSEHQMKIEELIELNSDLDSLLLNTEIGVLFLDERLNVRKYTQAAKKYVHIMERDVGRSIRHLAIRINFPTFVHELETAVAEARTVEYEAHNAPTDIVLVRIVPYKRNAGLSQGVTVIFISVNFQSEIVEKIGAQQLASFEKLLDSLPWPGFIKSDSGVYLYANQRMNDFAARNLVGAKDETWLPQDIAQAFSSQDSGVLKGNIPSKEHFKAYRQSGAVLESKSERLGANAQDLGSANQEAATYTRSVFKLETVKMGLEKAVAGIIVPDQSTSSSS